MGLGRGFATVLLLTLLLFGGLRAFGRLHDEGLEASGFHRISLAGELVDLRKEFIMLDLGKLEAFAGLFDHQSGERDVIEVIGILNVALCLLDLREQLVHACLRDRDLAVDRGQLVAVPHAGLISQFISLGWTALLTAIFFAESGVKRTWVVESNARAVEYVGRLCALRLRLRTLLTFGAWLPATRVFGFEPSDRFTQHHATEHDTELFELGMALGTDATVVVAVLQGRHVLPFGISAILVGLTCAGHILENGAVGLARHVGNRLAVREVLAIEDCTSDSFGGGDVVEPSTFVA